MNKRLRKIINYYGIKKQLKYFQSEIFELNEMEKDMILHHMWPVTIIPPKTKEGFLLTLIDKYCAMIEIKKGLINNLNTNFYFNYFYLMFVIMIGKLWDNTCSFFKNKCWLKTSIIVYYN